MLGQVQLDRRDALPCRFKGRRHGVQRGRRGRGERGADQAPRPRGSGVGAVGHVAPCGARLLTRLLDIAQRKTADGAYLHQRRRAQLAQQLRRRYQPGQHVDAQHRVEIVLGLELRMHRLPLPAEQAIEQGQTVRQTRHAAQGQGGARQRHRHAQVAGTLHQRQRHRLHLGPVGRRGGRHRAVVFGFRRAVEGLFQREELRVVFEAVAAGGIRCEGRGKAGNRHIVHLHPVSPGRLRGSAQRRVGYQDIRHSMRIGCRPRTN
jgi:hypothetical protein